jgi:hypothetical protein
MRVFLLYMFDFRCEFSFSLLTTSDITSVFLPVFSLEKKTPKTELDISPTRHTSKMTTTAAQPPVAITAIKLFKAAMIALIVTIIVLAADREVLTAVLALRSAVLTFLCAVLTMPLAGCFTVLLLAPADGLILNPVWP